MATVTRPAAPVNGRPARSRTAPAKLADPTPPSPRLLVVLNSGVECIDQYMVVDYPPGTPARFQDITPDQHREAGIAAVLVGARRFSSRAEHSLDFHFMSPVVMSSGVWAWDCVSLDHATIWTDLGGLFRWGADA